MDIVEEIRQDREKGAKRLESEYKAGLMALARRFCADPSDAEELVNATFATVVANIDDYLEQSAFFAWMCQILTSLHARNVRRKSNRDVIYPGAVPDVIDDVAHEEIYRSLDRTLVRDALEKLEAEDREILLLHYFLDIPIGKMAKVLAIPAGTVKSRPHYARRALAAKLGAAVKKPGAKALLIVLALAALVAMGAAVISAAGWGERSVPADTPDSDCPFVDNGEPLESLGNGQSSCPQTSANDNGPQTTGKVPSAPILFTPATPGETMKQTSIARTSAALTAASLALAATAQATDLAYRTPSATPYTWTGGKWITNDSNKDPQPDPPTASDNVFIWASNLKADGSDAGNPLCVASGEIALTKYFTIGWNDASLSTSNNKILFEIQSGGVMTNAGPVRLGVVESGATQTNPGGLATVRSGGLWVARDAVTVGASSTGNRNRIVIEQGSAMEADTGKKEFIVANVAGHSACVTNAGTLAVYDFFAGGYGNGDFENSGDFTVGRKFTIGRQAGSYGHVRHSAGTLSKGTPSSQPLYVGYNGIGVFEVFAPLSLQKNERLVLGGTATGEGTLVLGTGGLIGNVTNVSVGAFVAGARGHLRMEGGTLAIQALASGSPYALLVGRIGSSGTQQAWGDIRGHGTIARDLRDRATRIKLYGQVVADGGDLDLGSLKTVGNSGVDANKCGTNGWYAVNGGRLLYPAAQDFSYAEHTTIGDYVYRGGVGDRADAMDITLVNALQLRVYDASGNQPVGPYYNHAALYAPDRNDIPGTVPGSKGGDVTLGVWRLGHFDAPGDAASANAVPVDKAWLRFRIDSEALPEGIDWSQQKVRLYRWDGTDWRIVGTSVEEDLPYVETRDAQPTHSSIDANGKTWNIGWYAVALVRNGGMILIVR